MNAACRQCARRAWLIAKLSSRLDYRARNLSRLWPLLELPDVEMIEALGGRRATELQAAYASWEPDVTSNESPAIGGRATATQPDADIQTICRHHAAYPRSLREHVLSPSVLMISGDFDRFDGMLGEKVVAIVGARKASDYGMEVARNLARGLAASGLTIASGLAEGIPVAAHSGALEARGSTVTVMAGGLERCSPAWCRGLHSRIVASGSAISEMAALDGRAHRWWAAGRVRTLALLAELVIVVEAEDNPWELACASVAQAHGRLVAAVPGRVSSTASRGANSLLMQSARLVRGPQDALDILYGVGAREQIDAVVDLEPRLYMVLKQVGDGADTIGKLTVSGSDAGEIALALSELELHGLLSRGDGGRYVPSGAALPA